MRSTTRNDGDSPESDDSSDSNYVQSGQKKQSTSTTVKKQQHDKVTVQIPDGSSASVKPRDTPEPKRRRRKIYTLEEAHRKIDVLTKLNKAKIKKLDSSNGRCQKVKKTRDDAVHSVVQLEKEIEDFTSEVLGLKAELQQLQAEQLDRLNKQTHPAHNDRWLITNLEKIFAESKKWSKTWTLGAWNDGQLAQLQEAGQPDPTHLASPQAQHAMQAARLPTWLVMNAILNEFFCSQTFGCPFACLRKDRDKDIGCNIERALDHVMRRIKSSMDHSRPTVVFANICFLESVATENTVRASILRALDAPVLEEKESGSLLPLARGMRDSIKAACTEMMSWFLGRYHALLIVQEDQEAKMRKSQLQSIFEAAMGLSTSLATQNPELRVCFLAQMSGTCFSLDHPQLRAHRAMGLKEEIDAQYGLDPKKIGIDGRPIDMVIEPMVVRIGDEEGENYEIEKILKKAEIWMVKEQGLVGCPQPPVKKPPNPAKGKQQRPQAVQQEGLAAAHGKREIEASSTAKTEICSEAGHTSRSCPGNPATDAQRGRRKEKRQDEKRALKLELDNANSGPSRNISSLSDLQAHETKTLGTGSTSPPSSTKRKAVEAQSEEPRSDANTIEVESLPHTKRMVNLPFQVRIKRSCI